jgi:hypothetical protein
MPVSVADSNCANIAAALKALVDADPDYIATISGNAVTIRRADSATFTLNIAARDDRDEREIIGSSAFPLLSSPRFAPDGQRIVFIARLLPVVRTFIAFPAGVARMDMGRFILYTFAGSLPWCLGLAYVGQLL